MEYDITSTIANFVREADSHLDQGMKAQQKALRLTTCSNPFYEHWIEIGVEFLFSALRLEQADFVVRFPALAHVSKPARGRFLKRLEDHLSTCRSCALRHEHELDLNSRIEEALQANRNFLIEQLAAESD